MDGLTPAPSPPYDAADACFQLRVHAARCSELIRLRVLACVEVLEKALALEPTNVQKTPWVDRG